MTNKKLPLTLLLLSHFRLHCKTTKHITSHNQQEPPFETPITNTFLTIVKLPLTPLPIINKELPSDTLLPPTHSLLSSLPPCRSAALSARQGFNARLLRAGLLATIISPPKLEMRRSLPLGAAD